MYSLIGRVVVWAAKRELRRRYGPQLVPRPVLGGVVVALVLIIAIRQGKSQT